ncbi:MAG: BatD family protein [Saprospiraceae bacterium]
MRSTTPRLAIITMLYAMVSAAKSYEYLIIPKHEGDFEIPAINFSVFDLESGKI